MSYKGNFWDVKDVSLYPKPVQQPHLPTYVAAVTPPSYEMAARMGYSVMRAPQFTRIELVEEQWQSYCELIRQGGGDANSMDQPLLMRTYVAETEEGAKRDAEPHALWFHKLLQDLLPGALGKPPAAGYELYAKVRESHAKVTFEELHNWGTAIGDPDQVTERIEVYAERTGVNHWLSEMKFGAMSYDKAKRSMELLAKHVMPAFR